MGFFEGVEMAVELGFESRLGPPADFGSGLQTECQEVTALKEWARRGIRDFQALGDASELGDRIGRDARARRPSEGVGGHHDTQAFDRFRNESPSQPADRAIGGFLEMGHVLGDEGQDTFDDGVRRQHAAEKRLGEVRALVFVARGDDSRPTVSLGGGGGGGFAEVVGENREGPHDALVLGGTAPFGKLDQGVQGVERMAEDIPFGMPFGILWNAAKVGDLGEMDEPAGLVEETEAGGGEGAS